MRFARSLLVVFVLVAATFTAVPASTQELPSVPPGFAITRYGEVSGLATSIAFGPDTRNLTKTRLYAASFGRGQVVAIDDVGGTGSPATTFASGFGSPLGVLVAGDGTVFVSDSEGPRDGPFGNRPYGRVWRLRDTNADGDALDPSDLKEIVIKDLPNGRHNTNGMAFGTDGLLYITNGNSTDDGVEGGEPEAQPWSGSVIRVDPSATNLAIRSRGPRAILVATGMRNIFDIAFSPVDPTKLLIPMNGLDDARENDEPPPNHIEDSDDLLYITDIDDEGRDDFGFPSCLYNLKRQGNLEPYDNPNPRTIEEFGRCPADSVPRPLATFGLHPSADGLAFQKSAAWGSGFTNDLFVAEFGSFFGDEVTGHKVVRVEFDSSGSVVTGQSNFLSGGLPLDVTFDAQGNMYVVDFGGPIFKISKL